jgi:hypothetical protein
MPQAHYPLHSLQGAKSGFGRMGLFIWIRAVDEDACFA